MFVISVVAHRVTCLHGVRVRRGLSAQLRNQIYQVLSRMAPVVIDVDALPQSLVLAAPPTTSSPAAAGLRRVGSQAAHVTHARLR